MKTIYQPNQKINNLIFLEEVEPIVYKNNKSYRRAKFKCQCGNIFLARINHVKSRATNSCGCYHIKRAREYSTTHGLSDHPLFNIWSGMKTRCYNKNEKCYKYYGKRGITVCDEWLNNSETFIKWALENNWRRGLQIDRYPDNDGNYEPSNCRFITQAENIRNTRATKLNWKSVYEIRNIKLLIPNIAYQELGVAYNVSKQTIGNVLNNKSWI